VHPGLLLAALAALAAPPDPAPAPDPTAGPAARREGRREDRVARAVAAALAAAPPGGPRAAAATRPLHGLPYALDPLGEGRGPDADPRFRLDAFDCMTFVETAVALGSAATLDEARRALDDVRYDGPPALGARHHEVLSQWIPANLRKGWIAPLQGDWPAAAVATTYDEARWRRLARLGLSLPGVPAGRLPAGRFEVAVVPPDAFAALGARLPPGTIAFVLREERADRLTMVSHAGLVVAGPRGEPLLRHATSSLGVSRVIEEPPDRFVARQRAASRRPLAGFALFTILGRSAPPPAAVTR
jgi:transposase InsO family protein